MATIDASLVGEFDWRQSPFLERKPPHFADLDVPPHFSSLPILHFNDHHNTDHRHPEHPPPRPPQTRRRTRLHRRRFKRHVPAIIRDGRVVGDYHRAPPEIIEATRKILTAEIRGSVPKAVRDSIFFSVGCNRIPLFTNVRSGRGRTLFEFECVFE